MIKAYKFYENDEHKQVVMLLLKAREIGRKAADDQLKKLQKAGPRWNVVERVATGERKVGEMLDVCGGAYLTNGKKVVSEEEMNI